MPGLTPVVRYLIVCDDVVADPLNPRKINLLGLISTIWSQEFPPFPVIQREFCVFVQLTECRGRGLARVEVTHADSGNAVTRTSARSITFGNDPLAVVGIVFRIRECLFSSAGLYVVRFWYNDVVLAEQPILLR